jgi:RHS repeat-associated protein
MDIVRPTIAESWIYTQDTATEGNGTGPAGAYKTAFAYTYWGTGAELSPKSITTTMPSVSTSNNGPGSSMTTTRYLRKDGTTAFSLGAEGNYHYAQFTNGLMVKQIRDAKTNGTFASGDDPSTDFGISETGSGDDLVTTYVYDAQGRTTEVVAPDWQGATGTPAQVTYYTRLADQRSVVLSVPRRTVSGVTTTYTGPVSYTVMNHAGQTEFSATLELPSGSTTTAISSWISTTSSDPVQAVVLSGASLFRISTNVYGGDGRRVNASRTYFLNPSSLPGTSGTNYDERTFGYDDMGRQRRSVDATGTISRTVYDTLGRTTERWTGTNDTGLAGSPMSGTSNMTKTEAMVYDEGYSGRNSLLTQVTRYPDGTTGTRVTTYAYDTRDRRVLTTNPQSPHSLVKYDSAGRVIASGTYSSASGLSATSDPTSVTTNRLSLSETAYDEAGRAYRSTTHKITVSTGASAATLVSDTWHDAAGRVIKTRGSSIGKTFYDRQSRPYRQFTIAKLQNDAGSAAEPDNDIAQAGTVTGDLVLEERQTIYDTASGLPLFSVSLQRAHDDTTTTGARDGNADNDLATLTVASGGSNVDHVKTRVSITATWYDDLRRPIATAAYGSNSSSSGSAGNGATFTRPGTAPSRSDTVLVTSTSYNPDGTVLETTDPRGLISRTVLDDAGRTIKTIRNYTDGTPGGGTNNDQDQTIEYAYSKGLMTTYTAKMPGGTDQVTTYIYGTTGGGGALSNIATGHLLRATKYPDSSNAGTTVANIDSTDSDVVSLAYNALGQETRRKDQAGNVTETTYDTAGRPTARAVTTLASGFDGAVRRVEFTYTSKGQSLLVTQHSSSGGGSVVDEVKYVYDDWGHVTNFQQDRDSAVASAGGANGYHEAVYSYSSSPYQATGGAPAVRLETITLPGSLAVTYDYGTANGIGDASHRVANVKLSSTTIASYAYLGNGTLVGTDLPAMGSGAVRRLYGSSAGDYSKLDTFGRVVNDTWLGNNGTGRAYHDVTLKYDRNSNITSIDDAVTAYAGFDAAFAMDALNRLIDADEGTLSSGSITSRTRREGWTLNQAGAWTARTTDLDGSGTYTSTGFQATNEINETRTFNAANEVLTRVDNAVTKSPTHDANGNLTDDGVNYTYEYDAFGRLRKVKNRSNSAVVEENVYNGLNQRIGWHYDADADGDVDGNDPWYWFVQDLRWRTVATYRVPTSWTSSADSSPKERFIHHAAGVAGSVSSSYIDDVILRDRDNSSGWLTTSDGTLEERFFHLHNWRHDLIALGKSDGTLVERVKYSAYGVATRLDPADYNGDSFIDFFDDDDFDTDYTATNAKADFDYNGTVNSTDSTRWDTAYLAGSITARGVLSTTNATTGTNNRSGYAGYQFSPATQQYHVRHRALNPLVGQWLTRDPMEYADGSDLYMYVMNMPISGIDPMGLSCFGMSCPETPKLQPSGPSYDYPLDSGNPYDGLWSTPLRFRTPPRSNPGSTGPSGPTSPGGAPGFFTELQGSGGADCFIGPVKMSIKVERSQGVCICKSYDGSICVRPYERTRVCIELGLGVGIGCKYKLSGNIATEPVGECPQGGGEPPEDFDLCLKCSVGGVIGSLECKACVKIPSGRTTFGCSLKASTGGASGGCSISAGSCYTWVKYTGNENCGCVHEI